MFKLKDINTFHLSLVPQNTEPQIIIPNFNFHSAAGRDQPLAYNP